MSFLTELSKLIQQNQHYCATLLSCFIGYISAFATFTVYFKDPFKILFFSWEGHCYSFLNGAFAFFTFQLAQVINITISGISFNEHAFILAVIIGIAGHKVFLSFFKSKGESNTTITSDFDHFFDKIQSFLFHRYAVKRNLRLHSEVMRFMSDFPPEKLNELSLSCQIIAREINEDDCNRLIKKLSEIISYDISGESKVINVGLELSKYLDSDLIEQFAKKVIADEKLSKSKESAVSMLDKIKETLAKEVGGEK